MALAPQGSTPRATRTTQLAFELLFSGTTSFLLTSAILPLLGLHPDPLTVLRVTGFSTLVVFAALDVVFGVARRFTGRRVVVHEENPELKLNPACRWRDAEGGWPREKA
ncbi:hypothetical protein DFH06DRAFT_346664 [Mycena polygramma]|nr:hypothetical protein DFH06DRAFT_346664 [Mycena polygramma]